MDSSVFYNLLPFSPIYPSTPSTTMPTKGNDEKALLCITCSKPFSRATFLNRHRDRFHNDEVFCLLCNQQLSKTEPVRVHMSLQHRITIATTCTCCGWTFADRNQMMHHETAIAETGRVGVYEPIAKTHWPAGAQREASLRATAAVEKVQMSPEESVLGIQKTSSSSYLNSNFTFQAEREPETRPKTPIKEPKSLKRPYPDTPKSARSMWPGTPRGGDIFSPSIAPPFNTFNPTPTVLPPLQFNTLEEAMNYAMKCTPFTPSMMTPSMVKAVEDVAKKMVKGYVEESPVTTVSLAPKPLKFSMAQLTAEVPITTMTTFMAPSSSFMVPIASKPPPVEILTVDDEEVNEEVQEVLDCQTTSSPSGYQQMISEYPKFRTVAEALHHVIRAANIPESSLGDQMLSDELMRVAGDLVDKPKTENSGKSDMALKFWDDCGMSKELLEDSEFMESVREVVRAREKKASLEDESHMVPKLPELEEQQLEDKENQSCPQPLPTPTLTFIDAMSLIFAKIPFSKEQLTRQETWKSISDTALKLTGGIGPTSDELLKIPRIFKGMGVAMEKEKSMV